jgi:hypothetical protein
LLAALGAAGCSLIYTGSGYGRMGMGQVKKAHLSDRMWCLNPRVKFRGVIWRCHMHWRSQGGRQGPWPPNVTTKFFLDSI